MSAATLHRRLRRQMPWLTPTFTGDDDAALRVPPLDPELLTTTADIVPTIPLLNRRPLNLVPFDETAPPPPIAGLTRMPTRLSDEQVDEIGAPPMVIRRDGRPTTQFIGEGTPEERLLTRRRALEQYQPQKESKKSLILRTLLGQLRGGLIGEGGSLDTLLGQGGILDRRGKDRAWQQEQLGQVDAQYGRMRADRRAGLQDDLLESQVLENKADAAAKMRERAVPPIKDIEVGGRLLRPNAQGGYDEVYAPPVKPGSTQRPLLRSVTAPDGSTRTLKSTDNGETWQQVPELQGAPKPEPPDTAPFTNENLQRNISEAEGEKRKVAAALANTAEFLDQFNEKPNPIHQSLKARERELDDKIRAWRADLKAPRRALAVTPRSNARKWSASKWAAANPSGDLNKAKAEAKRQGLQVVE